jgi:hypothetical protein
MANDRAALLSAARPRKEFFCRDAPDEAGGDVFAPLIKKVGKGRYFVRHNRTMAPPLATRNPRLFRKVMLILYLRLEEGVTAVANFLSYSKSPYKVSLRKNIPFWRS